MNSLEMIFKDESVKLVAFVDEIQISRTQAIRTLLIEKDGEEYIALQKWWRASATEPWQEGKGFHLDIMDAEQIAESLRKAVEWLKESQG